MAFSIESQGQKDLKMVKAVCICKKRLMLRSTAKLGFESIVCDKCEKTCDDTKVFRCVNTSAADIHKGGYDLCIECGISIDCGHKYDAKNINLYLRVIQINKIQTRQLNRNDNEVWME
eukprot:882609_1